MSKIGNLTRFVKGPPAQTARHNDTIHTVNYLMRRGIEENIVPRRSGGGGGTPIRNAFCKNDAGGGKYIQVYLDTNLTGEQVYVECTLIGATNLSQCFPTLTEGVRIPVWFDGTHWRCLWWFQGYDVCAEPGE